MRVAAVVLAAGKSSRMGRNKLLLEVDGATVLDRLLASLTSVLGEVIVVTGKDPEPIRAIAESRGASVVHNPNYEEGMTTSFQAGLRAASADAVFLVLGDQTRPRAESPSENDRCDGGRPISPHREPSLRGQEGPPDALQETPV